MISRPLALDLFCGAGGAAMGLWRAGFDVIGVDIRPQPRYSFRFVQGDALSPPFDLTRFDLIWASPPCQADSQLTPKKYRGRHKALIAETRAALEHLGIPFCIENVPSAEWRMKRPLKLCGSMFGLKVRRHRFFELGGFYPAMLLPPCDHSIAPVLISGTHRRSYEPRYEYGAQECRDAADLQWMTRADMDNAIPPAYSEFIGRAAMRHIRP